MKLINYGTSNQKDCERYGKRKPIDEFDEGKKGYKKMSGVSTRMCARKKRNKYIYIYDEKARHRYIEHDD